MAPEVVDRPALFNSMPAKLPVAVPAVFASNVIPPWTVVMLEPLVSEILLVASRFTGPPSELIGAATVMVSGGSTSRPPAPTVTAALMATVLPVESILIDLSSFEPPTTPLNWTSPLALTAKVLGAEFTPLSARPRGSMPVVTRLWRPLPSRFAR